MKLADKILYLVNVLAIATADGEVAQAEAMALQDIMLRLGAGQEELQAAQRRLATPSGAALTPLPDPADCMACIEDMVLIALADGAPHADETGPIEEFMDRLGFVQADMDLIMPRVRKRAQALGLGTSFAASRLAAAPAPRNVTDPKRPALRTVVGRDDARRRLDAAATARSERPPPLPAKKKAEATERPPPAGGRQPAAPPPSAVAPAAASAAPSRVASAAVPSLAACQKARRASPAGEGHCWGAPAGPLNPWGCRLLEMDWDPAAAWFASGEFRDGETFVFDRAAIRELLEARLEEVKSCPYLNRRFALAACDALPSRASTAGRWRHRERAAGESGATALRIRVYSHGCAGERVCWSDALVPTDDRDAELTIARAARRLGHPAPAWEKSLA
jgi:hypothetical protein